MNICKKIGMNITVKTYLLSKVKPDVVAPVQSISILGSEIIKENCEFEFHYNKTDAKPTVLDGWISNYPGKNGLATKRSCVHITITFQ